MSDSEKSVYCTGIAHGATFGIVVGALIAIITFLAS